MSFLTTGKLDQSTKDRARYLLEVGGRSVEEILENAKIHDDNKGYGGKFMSAVEDYIKEVSEELIAKQAGRAGAATPKMEVPAVPEPVKVLPKPKCKKGQKLFSTVFGVAPLSGIDHPVTIVPKNAETACHRQEVDERFVPTVEALEEMVVAIETGDNVLITGPTGSGKSSLATYVAAKTQRPMVRVNMSGDVESSALFGSYTVEEGATVFHRGPVTEAVQEGYTLLIDEYDVMPPEIAMTMQWLLEENGKLYLKEMAGTSEEKVITPHKNFHVILTGNTQGQGDATASYAGTTVQNGAFIDRCGTAIELAYLSHFHEKALVTSRVPEIDEREVDKMLAIADHIRTAYNQSGLGLTMSPRTLVSWAKKSVYWQNSLTAFRIAYFGKLVSSDKDVVNTFLQKVYGETL